VADPVAIIALSLSGVLAVWEFAKRALDGARVRVRLHAGLYTPHSLSKSTKSWANLAEMTADKGGWPTEVAIIEIENPGREAVTVSDISLDFGRMHWWKPWWRRHASPYPLPGHGGTQKPSIRMEPFDRAIVIIDVWQVLQPVDHHAFSLPDRPFPLRASVRVAGRRGCTLSPLRKRWQVRVGQVSFIGPTVEPGMAMHQSAVRWIGEHDDLAHPINVEMALDYRTRFRLDGPAPTQPEIMTMIKKHTHGEEVPGMKHIWSLYIARDLAYHYRQEPRP
jgi:hypothetical protein